jgi:hypothetical protein
VRDHRHRRQVRRFLVEPLEPRALLSSQSPTAGPATDAAAPTAQVRQAARAVRLDVTLKGVYTLDRGLPDVGSGYQVYTSGQGGVIGMLSVTGTLQSTGSIAQGHATGTLNVAASRGTFTLALTGPAQPGFSALPSEFSYTLTGGTGRYKGVTGTGTATVVLHPSNVPSGNGQGKAVITLRTESESWVV